MNAAQQAKDAMQTFEQIWESSRTNYLSWAYPYVLWSGVAVLIVLSLVRSTWLRRSAKIIVIIALPLLATQCSLYEIQEKWRIRVEWARDHGTPADWEAIARRDGANLTLGPLLYGFFAFALFAFVAFGLWAVRIVITHARKQRDNVIDSNSQQSDARRASE